MTTRRSFIAGGLAAFTTVTSSWRPNKAKAEVLDASQFGAVADAGTDGSGTDAGDALQAFFDRIAEGGIERAHIPPGRYRVSRELILTSEKLENLMLEAEGAELVFVHPAPQANRAYLRIANTVREGRRLHIVGLHARLNRPAIRTSHSDMLRLTGFRQYAVEGVAIGSADNMGLTIGRGDPFGWTPESIRIEGCVVGGHREELPHSNGSIGDSGIWVITPASETLITGCIVGETGDDGIYVGHSDSTTIQRVEIRENRLYDTVGGIGTAIPNTEIVDNHVNRTGVCAVRAEWQNGSQGSNCLIARNRIHRAGQLEAGDIGQRMMRKVHPHAIFIYQPIGNVVIRDNAISNTRECALAMMPHRYGPLSDVVVENGSYDRIGVDRHDAPQSPEARVAVFRRVPKKSSSVHRFTARNPLITNTHQSLLGWTANGPQPDGDVQVDDARLVACRLEGVPLAWVDGPQAPSTRFVSVTYRSFASVVPDFAVSNGCLEPASAENVRVLRLP